MAQVQIILIPFKDKGHMSPAATLARRLGALGASVTILLPEPEQCESSAIRKLQSDRSSSSSSSSFTILSLPSCEEDGERAAALEAELQRLAAAAPPESAVVVVADAILWWVGGAVSRCKLRRYIFYTSGATSLSYMFRLHGEPPPGRGGGRGGGRHGGRGRGRGGRGGPPPFDWRKDLEEAEGVLVNTCLELEPEAVQLIRSGAKDNLLPIGPLLDLGQAAGGAAAACLEWLDSQKPASVVYVCFGSREDIGPREEQIQEIAVALEACEQPFLWVVPKGKWIWLPAGLLDRCGGSSKGMIVEWAPQAAVLSHASIAAFVTHCGWNSVAECISLAAGGAVMVCWPLMADQPTNCKLLVEAGVGMRAKADDDSDDIVSSGVMEAKIRHAVAAEGMRQRMAELRERTLACASGGGSSAENLAKFMDLCSSPR